MTTAMNVCKILPQGDTASVAGATERASGKPQGRFADTPALAELRKDLGSDKIEPSATPEGGRSAGKQPVAHTSGQPNAPAKQQQKKESEGQGVTIGQPQGPVWMPTQTLATGEESKAAASVAAFPKAAVGEFAAGKVLAGKPSLSGAQTCHRPAHEVPESNPGSNDPQISAKQGLKGLTADTVVQGKAQTLVSEPVPTAIDKKVASKPLNGAGDGSASVGRAASSSAEQTSQGGTAIERTDGLPRPKTERSSLQTDNLMSSEAIKAIPSEKSAGSKPMLDQATPEVQSHREGQTVTAARVPEQKLGALLSEKHPAVSPASGGNPSIRNLSAETVPAAGKDTRSNEPQPGLQTRADFSVSSHGEPMPVAQRIPGAAQIPTTDSPASRSPVQHVSAQILDSVHACLSRGDKEVLVRLHPPELGSVLVRFQEQGRHVTGILEVGRSDTRHEIEQALPQVLRGLQDAGVQVRRFEVVMSDQPERDFNRGQWQQHAGPQQQNSGQQRDYSAMSAEANWSQGDVSHSPQGEEISSIYPPAGVAQGRLDMLL